MSMLRSGQSDVMVRTTRLDIAYPTMSDFAEWAAVRRASRANLEPFEPAWTADALSRADWSRRLRRWREQRRDGEAHVFLVRRRADKRLAGGAALSNVRFGSVNSAGLGYWLGDAFKGDGLMTEAVVGVCSWAFQSLGLYRIEAGTVPENTASQAVLRRAGFKEEGRARGYLEINGRRRDHVMFGLIRSDLLG
ncbi:MAG: GNAT family protein [Pseudomonadota bacterium]